MQPHNQTLRRILICGLLLLIPTSYLLAQQYDIYVFDIKSGTTRRVNHIPGASCYNVTWSNNGKKIAHDVVGGPVTIGQSIYITDVESGISTPLPGAEGGNDAAWSPNGTTIAFDLWEYNPYYNSYLNNIYLVPSAGGIRSLFRLHSNHASWNNSSRRIAFADNWGGYIGTKSLDDSSETFVTYGNWPSWSPNGQYIAYNGWGGGVWVIAVDPMGLPTGNPVQLSLSGYGPTWSNNSKSIVYIDWPNGDPDLYSIPVTGGTPQRVTGRVAGFDKGDYDPCYSNNGKQIAYSGFTDPEVTQTRTRENLMPGIILQHNYPNPFNNNTTISFQLQKTARVQIEVYNSLGQKISTICSGDYTAGDHSVYWDGKDMQRNSASPGLYYCRLMAGNEMKVIVMEKLRG